MRNFRCLCGNTVYFENTHCIVCGRMLGYLPERGELSVLDPGGDGVWRAVTAGNALYRQCRNYSQTHVCNWMVPASDPDPYCLSCRLNHMIPDLSLPRNLTLWYRIEVAKRRLIYTLLALKLPLVGLNQDSQGVAFDFLADTDSTGEFQDEDDYQCRILTGHSGGLITINLAEADPGARERIREQLNELYRTLLGHFRHESGHYYWDRLIRNSPHLGAFRGLFGDERQDYKGALDRYYASGGGDTWHEYYVSAYASAHPWEDWAETWAHYLHMMDTLETAEDEGMAVQGVEVRSFLSGSAVDLDDMCGQWMRLTLALNAVARSLGLADPYPFVLSERVVEKLRFVHERVLETAK